MIKRLVKRILFKFGSWLGYQLHKRKLNKSIRKAKQYHKLTGKQYLVIQEDSGKYRVIDNQWHKDFNKVAKKSGSKCYTYKELLEMCVFKTAQGTYKSRK